jgi:hypothetical protein
MMKRVSYLGFASTSYGTLIMGYLQVEISPFFRAYALFG